MKTYTFTKSYEMFEEAKKYIPGGIYGPRSPMFLTFGSYPCFLERGKGCHVWDVDGNEYIDYMCSFGTNILGLGAEVEAEISEQASGGHADEMETSNMLCIRPDLVKMERAVEEISPVAPGTRGKGGVQKIYVAGKMTTASGINGNATLANPEKGQKLLAAMAQDIVDFCNEFAKG